MTAGVDDLIGRQVNTVPKVCAPIALPTGNAMKSQAVMAAPAADGEASQRISTLLIAM
jgi:hypothetical protein